MLLSLPRVHDEKQNPEAAVGSKPNLFRVYAVLHFTTTNDAYQARHEASYLLDVSAKPIVVNRA